MTTDCKCKIVIAIDGYSSSGKSTMAKQLAKDIGYRYIDSGAMYRAVTLYALRHGLIADGEMDTQGIISALPEISIDFNVAPDGTSRTMLCGEDVESEIRGMNVAEWVSPVATIPEVRHRLTTIQQQMGSQKGIVMDGRDIGTTVFPDAELKIFVNATPETRARRRVKELQGKGMDVNYEEVYKNICERDHTDRTRKESPLRQASDAIVLDNDNMTLGEQEEWMRTAYKTVIERICK